MPYGRDGYTPPPPNKMGKCSLSYFLIYQIKRKHIIHQFLALFLWYVFSVLHVTTTNKKHTI